MTRHALTRAELEALNSACSLVLAGDNVMAGMKPAMWRALGRAQEKIQAQLHGTVAPVALADPAPEEGVSMTDKEKAVLQAAREYARSHAAYEVAREKQSDAVQRKDPPCKKEEYIALSTASNAALIASGAALHELGRVALALAEDSPEGR